LRCHDHKTSEHFSHTLTHQPAIADLLPSCHSRALSSQDDCIQTPEEFFQAFAARSPRCVSPWLHTRVGQSSKQGGAPSDPLTGVSTGATLARFWGGHDAAEKYLRIGVPKTPGFFTNDPTLEPSNTYGAPTFAGLAQRSNGQSLMEQIGYNAVGGGGMGRLH